MWLLQQHIHRDNLINSAIIELVEFIRQVNPPPSAPLPSAAAERPHIDGLSRGARGRAAALCTPPSRY